VSHVELPNLLGEAALRPCAGPYRIEGFINKVWLALLAAQAVLCLGAMITRIMFHGEGS
jgi:hypothetical protein